MRGSIRPTQILRTLLAIATGAAAAVANPITGYGSQSASYSVGPIVNLTTSCAGQNAEVEQAVDPTNSYIYEEWMGCSGIGFSRSIDGGRTFSDPVSVPSSVGSNVNSWDPALAVAPDGTLYAAFMVAHAAQWYPVVAASFDHGTTFSQVTSLVPPDAKNWGDREFIAVGPDGTVYVTWDYGPERTSVTFVCASSGSCAFSTGDLNVVMQTSHNRGQSFGAMSHVSPGFPASGGDSGPMVVEPGGRVDVLYQGYHITDTSKYTMDPAYSYFTFSDNQGATWSTPVPLGTLGQTMSLSEWWIDGAIGRDAGGNLYATWDTQGTNPDGSANDLGWLAFSTNRGRTWSAPIQAPADQLNVPHIMEVAGAGSGVAYVGWLSNSNPLGYAQYLRAFSINRGWLSVPVQVSAQFGDSSVWPGDTFGISTMPSGRVAVSWGSAVPSVGKKSDVYATTVGIS